MVQVETCRVQLSDTDKTIFDLDVDAFKKVVDLNLFGTVIPTMVFAKVMVEQKQKATLSISLQNLHFAR